MFGRAALARRGRRRSPRRWPCSTRSAWPTLAAAPAATLTLAGQKRLEVARAIATGARLVLLDEVMAGLTATEVAQMLETLRRMRDSRGLTLIVIEHVMQALMKLCARIVVLHHGERIAEGTPERSATTSACCRSTSERRHERAAAAHRVAGRRLRCDTHPARPRPRRSRRTASTALLGANGAGKTTLMKTLAGVLPASGGRILLPRRGHHRPPAAARVLAGIVLVPEGRLVFPELSVHENLRLGAVNRRARAGWRGALDEVHAIFPKLLERRHQAAATLSGGEQQMLAIGRGLMARPTLMLLDEPTLGLAPVMALQMFELIRTLSRVDHPAGRRAGRAAHARRGAAAPT